MRTRTPIAKICVSSAESYAVFIGAGQAGPGDGVLVFVNGSLSKPWDCFNLSKLPDGGLQVERNGDERAALDVGRAESVFGLCATAPITFLERGPGIESLANILAHYLEGDYTEKPVIEKWLEDLIDAATTASSAAPNKATMSEKRVSKPSAAQMRTNEWLQSRTDATTFRKRKRDEATQEAEQHAKLIEKTSQRVNWRKGLEDLTDVKIKPKKKKTGRPGYPIVDKLVIECVTQSTGQRRWRCSAAGCQESWASRQAQRVLSHATEECCFIDAELRTASLDQSGKLSPGY
ncbi:hypothetical protein FRC07_007281 [Ceratobasidium sp. 392]|nr:hypothetical protein FRC07_007281 [Ceratobasidium sp. 392]